VTLGRAELYLVVFIAGAAVLAVEIVGTRIIGPVFGVDLFVWAALLAVTLGSLAVGYYAGGVLADRRPVPRLVGGVVVAAGLALCVSRWITSVVLGAAMGLGPRGGPLLSAVLLFAPCLTALGMVGPIAVRLALSDALVAGRRVGSMYAVSTAGSVLGTLLIAFVFLPAFDTGQTVVGIAFMLIVTGGVSLARHWRAAALVALIAPALALGSSPPPLPSGVEVLDRAQSLYGAVQVIDDTNRGVRFLRADHSVIGAQFTADGSAAFSFLHLLEAVRFARPDAKEVLQIGLGIGSLPRALEHAGMRVDVVEIDPAVVRLARSHFGFSSRGRLHVEDARTFLHTTDERYDVVLHDAFTGGTTPEHLLSVEVVERVHAILRPRGVLVLNFVGFHDGPHAEASRVVARTLRAVFRNVQAFRDSDPADARHELANVAFFATDGPLEFVIPSDATFENARCERAQRSFQRWEVLKDVPAGPLVTDANNPLGRLQLPAAAQYFAAMNELLPRAVWLQ